MKFKRVLPVVIMSLGVYLPGCGSGGSSGTGPMLGSAGVDTVLRSVTAVGAAAPVALQPAAVLPAPIKASTGIDVVWRTAGLPAGTISLTVVTYKPVDDILIGSPGYSGYFDIPVTGIGQHDPANPNQVTYPLSIVLSPTAPTILYLRIQTLTGGTTGSRTYIDLSRRIQTGAGGEGCGGGVITAAFSNVVDTNADTSILELVAGGTYQTSQGLNVGARQCFPVAVDLEREMSVSLIPRPVAAQSYPLADPAQGAGAPATILYFSHEAAWISTSGTLTILAVEAGTVLFSAHAHLEPAHVVLDNPGATIHPIMGVFDVDVHGAVDISGL